MTPLVLLVTLGCADAPAPVAPVTLDVAADRATFATAEELGAYVLEARVVTTHEPDGGDVTTTEELTRLRWQDDMHWQYVRERAGERLSDTRVWEGEVWRAGRSGQLRAGGDAEVARMELGRQADPWERTLGPLASRVQLTEVGEDNVETRRAHRYQLSLKPAPPTSRKSTEVTGVEGQVWIDEATAVRLAGEVTVTTRGKRARTTRQLRFSMSAIGGQAEVPAPEP